MHQTQLALYLARELRQRDVDHAARERQLTGSRGSVRKAIGRRVMALGAWIAADSAFELVRSR